ncbi:MAG TPA: ion transporter [Trueperaceae bacterium]
MAASGPQQEPHESERLKVLAQFEERLETPMVVLGFVWLALFVLEVVWGTTPFLALLGGIIWFIFLVDFLIRFGLAPHKGRYLRHNWLAAISLALPALRIFRLARVLRILSLSRTARGFRLVRVVSSLNRSMQSLAAVMGRRGFGYVVLLTLLVALAGAAGMYAFETGLPDGEGFTNYWQALWWTAMLLTTLGSEYWPQTAEGRLLCLLLALYGFAVFGYITATLASFFIGQDAESSDGPEAGSEDLEALRQEIAGLRGDLQERGPQA